VGTDRHSGPNRSARSNALLALALLVPAPTLGVLAAMWWWPGAGGQSIYVLSKIWIMVLPVLWLLKVERGRLTWARPEASSCGVGLVLGLALGATIVGAYLLLGSWIDVELFRAAATRIGLGTPVRYLGFAVYLSLINALVEEYVWRWFVFRKTEALVRGYSAVVLSALFFTAHHVFALAAQMPWLVTVLSSIGVFVGGAVWSWCYLRFRSIWPGYVSHLVADVAIFWIGWRLLFG
jgi:membrane protease YdiL (CAAX protease family)